MSTPSTHSFCKEAFDKAAFFKAAFFKATAEKQNCKPFSRQLLQKKTWVKMAAAEKHSFSNKHETQTWNTCKDTQTWNIYLYNTLFKPMKKTKKINMKIKKKINIFGPKKINILINISTKKINILESIFSIEKINNQ